MLTIRRHVGILDHMEPQYASGFGEALSAFLSQGGSRRKDKRGNRFMEGRLKGMTLDQATEKAKRMWAGASDAVKEKYAQRAGAGRLAPSEMAAFQDRQRTRPDNSGGAHDHSGFHGGSGMPEGGGPGVNPNAPTDPARTPPGGTSDEEIREGGGDGNMDAEIAAMTTPEMRREMAAQLEQGRPMATASTRPMWAGTFPTQEHVDRGRRNAAVQSGAADRDEVKEAEQLEREREKRRREQFGRDQAARRQRDQQRQRERAGLPPSRDPDPSPTPSSSSEPEDSPVDEYLENQQREADEARNRIDEAPQSPPNQVPTGTGRTRPPTAAEGNTSPEFAASNEQYTADAAPKIEADADLARKAREAGYVGNNAVARYKKDRKAGRVPENMNPEPLPANSRRMDGFGPSNRFNPIRSSGGARQQAAARAEAAIRPGVQKQIAQQSIATRSDGYQPRGHMEGIRMQAENERKHRELEANRLTMADVQRLGPMAVWGIDEELTNAQSDPGAGAIPLTRERIAAIRAARETTQPRMAAPIAPPQPRPRRPIASRR